MSKVLNAVVGRIKEKTRIANVFRQNACMRHGLQYEEDGDDLAVKVEHQHTHDHKGLEKERDAVEGLSQSVKDETKAVEGLTAAVKTEKSLPVAESLEMPAVIEEMEKEKRMDWLKKVLLAASLVGGGVGATMVTNYVMSDPLTVESKDGSLLQYLEDRGEHLPGGFEK